MRHDMSVSMYAELLSTALDEMSRSEDGSTTIQALATLLDCRRRIGSAYTGTNWAPTAIADQLAYDVALIQLAHHFGIETDSSSFDPHYHGRARLEHELVIRGIPLDSFDESKELQQQAPLKWGRR